MLRDAMMLFAVLGVVLGLVGCGDSHDSTTVQKTPVKPADAQTAADGALSLARLGSLTNYRAVMIHGMGTTSMTTRFQVHDATDWEMTTGGIRMRHVSGIKYTELAGQWKAKSDKPDAYARHALPAFAKQFFNMTHVRHASIEQSEACQQAGRNGHIWTIGANGGAILNEVFQACVDDSSGALLKLVVGAKGSATGGIKAHETYTIESIGDVPVLPVPSPVG